MAGTRLALPAALEIAAAGNKEAHQDDGENRGEASTEAGPVEVNKGEALLDWSSNTRRQRGALSTAEHKLSRAVSVRVRYIPPLIQHKVCVSARRHAFA